MEPLMPPMKHERSENLGPPSSGKRRRHDFNRPSTPARGTTDWGIDLNVTWTIWLESPRPTEDTYPSYWAGQMTYWEGHYGPRPEAPIQIQGHPTNQTWIQFKQ
ncbi:hypothetical protein PTTG_06500 [Puccinia triticina 1-1 BBBD Race 1]|uniref:Uncharacterized protein n=2 Tax=Puccinia triticina TaxID=208348 RepID=A0A0C4F084_PUCT1|nr:hypothetical protein PTTG_06500 [Puccinia triticina 1-1 BBBD Race 1]